MTRLRTSSVSIPSFRPDDPRIGEMLGKGVRDPAEARAVIVGFPSDEGVRRNNGRVGAASGPDEIRRFLFRLVPDPDLENHWAFRELIERTVDLGDMVMTGDLEFDQNALGSLIASYLERNVLPIILGGGHESAYGHFLGYVELGKPVRIVNFDAHPDVRGLIEGQGHSGSPFFQALVEHDDHCAGYHVFGINPHAASLGHLKFVRDNGGDVVFRDDVSKEAVSAFFEPLNEPTMATFDLDAIDQTAAPGVSAPSAFGLSPEIWLHAAEQAGRSPGVQSMDLCELNPNHDFDSRTARLAALTVWRFLRGFSQRLRLSQPAKSDSSS